MASGPPRAPVILIKTVLERKAAPGEVGGKLAASRPVILKHWWQKIKGLPGEVGGERFVSGARYLEQS